LASTSAEVFARIAAGGPPPDGGIIAALAASPPQELFGDLVEPLSDSFEPRFAAAYVEIFSRILEHAAGLDPLALCARYASLIRGPVEWQPRRVVVLSRVTIGADVAITSTLLRAAAERWPEARIEFAASRKNHELFAGDPRIGWLDAPYQRTGSLAERVRAGLRMRELLDDPVTLVIDPDSRLSQLGLLPLAAPERVLHFESRSCGSDTESLVDLTRQFARSTLGLEAQPWIRPPAPEWVPAADVAVSFGVGENPAKRFGDAFECEAVQGLLDRGLRVLLDSGAPGTAEAERAAAIELACRGPLFIWQGSFAPFAAAIARSRLYVGYDSAGQHVAAACGVPRITLFTGHPNPRFAARWRPDGPGASAVLHEAGQFWREVTRMSRHIDRER